MARRYARDNRGRFAPKGAGATARGGRLRTASGSKRQTVTTKSGMVSQGRLTGAPLKSTIGKTSNARLNIGLTRPSKPGQRQAYNAARAQLQAKTSAPKPGATKASARRKAVGRISEAKAGRIISRIDANRPGMRKATGSARKTANSIRTQRAATDFALAAGARARKQGKNISVNESLQRGVKNAAAKNASRAAAAKTSKAKPATASKLGGRLNPAKKADRRATQEFNKAYNRENRIRTSLFSGNKTQAQKDAIVKELNKASNLTASKLQQRREVRAQFPVQSKDKLLKASRASMPGTISRSKDVRNTVNRKAAFARRVTRAGALPSNNQGKKGRQTARTRAKALATYQGARRPEISDATVGFLSSARKSPTFKPMASRLATPSKAAQRSGKALANKAAGTARDKFGRRTMNSAKGTKKARTAARALEFYKNPKATAQKVLKDQGKAGKRTRGFRLPRGMR